MEPTKFQAGDLANPESSLENTLNAEIQLIESAPVAEEMIEEEIAALRYRFRQGTYQPGTSGLLPQNIDKPLQFDMGKRLS